MKNTFLLCIILLLLVSCKPNNHLEAKLNALNKQMDRGLILEQQGFDQLVTGQLEAYNRPYMLRELLERNKYLKHINAYRNRIYNSVREGKIYYIQIDSLKKLISNHIPASLFEEQYPNPEDICFNQNSTSDNKIYNILQEIKMKNLFFTSIANMSGWMSNEQPLGVFDGYDRGYRPYAFIIIPADKIIPNYKLNDQINLNIYTVQNSAPPIFQYQLNGDDQGFIQFYDTLSIPLTKAGLQEISLRFENVKTLDTVSHTYHLTVQSKK